ncbi:hypothetical protein H5410_040714 [Solanum commersonii]|uniref:Uncharacterized protein n=1 Tax=Solanum commersonii TaxID=4109 RepID=A0A9J5XSS1_SOLCO|nr:hypothetical protein H5410_040714 [Solanum commersonii]
MDPDCSWMYNRNNPGRAGMIPKFTDGVTRFINHAKTLDDFLTSRLIRCPCLWKQSDGKPIGGSVYGYPEKAYLKKKSWYCGSSSSSFDGGDRETISTMESKITYLNVELAIVVEREKKERVGDCGSKGGNILPPCSANIDGSDQEGDENDKSDIESEGDEK